MVNQANIEALGRLLEIEHRSLPMYLTGTSPSARGDSDQRAAAALAHLVADQTKMSERIANLLIERGGRVNVPGFPMEFTDMNMLSLDYLVREVINRQQYTIEEIRSCIAQLADDPEGRQLAEEVLGCERGHLENLEDLLKLPV